jgi:hypothetical protein
VPAKTFAELDLGKVGRKTQRHVLAPAAEEIDQQAAALDGAGHILEDEAGGVIVVQRHLGYHADLALVAEIPDLLDLAELARLLDPLPQVVIGECRRGVGTRAGCNGAADRRRHRIGCCAVRCALLGALLGHVSTAAFLGSAKMLIILRNSAGYPS